MKKFSFLFFVLIFIFAGCNSHPVAKTVFGQECRALNARETARLIHFTRVTLKRNAKRYKITPEEQRIIRTTPPDLRPEYRGDCYGTLFITWETPARRIGLRFENDFNAELPSCALAITSSDGKRAGSIQPDKSIRGR